MKRLCFQLALSTYLEHTIQQTLFPPDCVSLHTPACLVLLNCQECLAATMQLSHGLNVLFAEKVLGTQLGCLHHPNPHYGGKCDTMLDKNVLLLVWLLQNRFT